MNPGSKVTYHRSILPGRKKRIEDFHFKHIVNIKRIRGYNGVNIRKGYHSIEMRSPKDLADYEDE
jgi:hypothetical protein